MGNADYNAPKPRRRVQIKTSLLALWHERLRGMNEPAPQTGTGTPAAIRAALEEAHRARNRR